jgi:hypothetical protein
MTVVRRPFFFYITLFFTAVAAHAQSCQTHLFPYSVENVTLATVKTPREPILRDEEGCPGKGASCASYAYLVQGDHVLVAHGQSGYRCIAFFNGRRQTTGWVRQEGLTPTLPASATTTWLGAWTRRSGEAQIVIRKQGHELYATAMATLAVSRDNVRTGGAEGRLTVQGGNASFGEAGDRSTACRVHVRLLGDLLLADDGATDDSNSSCGGLGVSLNGIYRRTVNQNP